MQLHASDVHVQLFVSHSANLEPTACIAYCYPIKQHTKKSSAVHAVHIRGATIEMYKGPQGPGTKLTKSGTILAIRDR